MSQTAALGDMVHHTIHMGPIEHLSCCCKFSPELCVFIYCCNICQKLQCLAVAGKCLFLFVFKKNKNIYDLFLKIYVLSRNCLRTNSETNMSKYTIHVLAPIKHLEHEIYLTCLEKLLFLFVKNSCL